VIVPTATVRAIRVPAATAAGDGHHGIGTATAGMHPAMATATAGSHSYRVGPATAAARCRRVSTASLTGHFGLSPFDGPGVHGSQGYEYGVCPACTALGSVSTLADGCFDELALPVSNSIIPATGISPALRCSTFPARIGQPCYTLSSHVKRLSPFPVLPDHTERPLNHYG